MKKSFTKISAAVAALLLTAGSFSGCSKTEKGANNPDAATIEFGISATVSKNHFIDDDGVETGYELELLKLIDDELPQYKFNIQTMEFASLFVSLQSGNLNAAIGNFHRNDKRDASYRRSTYAYNFAPNNIMVFENDNTINGIEDLAGKKVGVGQGTNQAQALAEFSADHPELPAIELIYTKDYINDLYTGRVQAIVVPLFSLDFYNTCFDDVKFKLVGKPVETKEGAGADSNSYIYFPKTAENDQLFEDVSNAIKTLRENGELSKLITKFYPADYTKDIRTDLEEAYRASLK